MPAPAPPTRWCRTARARRRATSPAKGVTDTVIGSTDLAKEPVGIHDRLFRLRKLVVEPGGVVPWHSHGDRPALIYIISGEITEYSSTCAVPIVHRAGDTAPGDAHDIALVEEHRHDDGHAAVGRSVPRQGRSAHDVTPASAAPAWVDPARGPTAQQSVRPR